MNNNDDVFLKQMKGVNPIKKNIIIIIHYLKNF